MQVSKPVSDNKNAILLIAVGICFSAVIGYLIVMEHVSLAVSILASVSFLSIFLIILRDYRKGGLFFGAFD